MMDQQQFAEEICLLIKRRLLDLPNDRRENMLESYQYNEAAPGAWKSIQWICSEYAVDIEKIRKA